MSIYNSLFNITDLAGVDKTWVGLQNYIELFRDTNIHTSLINTAIMMVLMVVFELGLGALFALFVDGVRRGAKFYRTVFFFPVVISATAIGLMFFLFYDYNMGLFNQILMKFGAEKHLWMNESSALYMIAIPTIWQYVGFYFVIVLTGISTIPEDIYESAYLDGITGFKKTIYITLPLIKGVLKSSLILVITGTLSMDNCTKRYTEWQNVSSCYVPISYRLRCLSSRVWMCYSGSYCSHRAWYIITC